MRWASRGLCTSDPRKTEPVLPLSYSEAHPARTGRISVIGQGESVHEKRTGDEMDELLLLLGNTATNAERVRGLLMLGLPPRELTRATGCQSPSTLRNWASGQTQPRDHAAIVIDDLRITVRTLLGAGLEPERVVRWLLSRDTDHFQGMRPIDMIAVDPMDVLAAAQGERLDEEERTTRSRQPELALIGHGDDD